MLTLPGLTGHQVVSSLLASESPDGQAGAAGKTTGGTPHRTTSSPQHVCPRGPGRKQVLLPVFPPSSKAAPGDVGGPPQLPHVASSAVLSPEPLRAWGAQGRQNPCPEAPAGLLPVRTREGQGGSSRAVGHAGLGTCQPAPSWSPEGRGIARSRVQAEGSGGDTTHLLSPPRAAGRRTTEAPSRGALGTTALPAQRATHDAA